MTHVPFSRMSYEMKKFYGAALGPSPLPYNYRTSYAKKRYEDLTSWMDFLQNTEEYRKCGWVDEIGAVRARYPEAPIAPRFVSKEQVAAFQDNMLAELKEFSRSDLDYTYWLRDKGLAYPKDLRFWTPNQRREYRDNWFKEVKLLKLSSSIDKLSQMTYDQREAKGLLTRNEYSKLRSIRKRLYDKLFTPSAGMMFMDPAARNRMTSQKSS